MSYQRSVTFARKICRSESGLYATARQVELILKPSSLGLSKAPLRWTEAPGAEYMLHTPVKGVACTWRHADICRRDGKAKGTMAQIPGCR
jgi:hypothetical protein